MNLATHLRSQLISALSSISPEDRADLYVISLWVQDLDDDPRRPSITVGFNTERQVAECTPRASGPNEARWNFAFWLQNSLVEVCGERSDSLGASLRQAWATVRGIWYSDEDQERDFEATLKLDEALTDEFVNVAVQVVKELHTSGEITRILGRPVPVLIHELEYYEKIALQNEAANPPALVEAFATWVRTEG
jgi:hypothetical protein